MAERLKVLDHHVKFIEEFGFGFRNRGSILMRITEHVKGWHHDYYPFFDERARNKFAEAMAKAANARLDGNVEVVKDFASRYPDVRNFDLICHACPNFEEGKPTCNFPKSGR